MVAKFQFRLQAPLRLARINLLAVRRQLAALVARIRTIERRQDELEQQIREIRTAVAQRANEGVSGAELQRSAEEIITVRQSARALQRTSAELHQEEKSLQAQLRAAKRQIEALNEKRSQALSEHRAEIDREVQKQLDELTLYQFRREKSCFSPVGKKND